MRQLNIRIPDELSVLLEAHVKATGEKQSALVRRGIELAIGQQAGVGVVIPPEAPPSAAESPAVAPPETAPPVLDAAPEEDRERGDTGSSDLEVDFATWLSNRAGIPRAIAVRRIIAGKVEVDGRARYGERIQAADLRGQVTLDGAPV